MNNSELTIELCECLQEYDQEEFVRDIEHVGHIVSFYLAV